MSDLDQDRKIARQARTIKHAQDTLRVLLNCPDRQLRERVEELAKFLGVAK